MNPIHRVAIRDDVEAPCSTGLPNLVIGVTAVSTGIYHLERQDTADMGHLPDFDIGRSDRLSEALGTPYLPSESNTK